MKLRAPSRSRIPSNPATAAIQTPANAACAGRGGVVLEIVEVDEDSLGEVVVSELEVPDLGGDGCLGAGGQRGVAHGQRLVVGDVAGLGLLG